MRRHTSGGDLVLGPLPTLHRTLLVIATLVCCLGLGAWAGAESGVPVQVGPGMTVGLAIGVLAAFSFGHRPRHRDG